MEYFIYCLTKTIVEYIQYYSMITELVVISPLILLYRWGWINFYHVIIFIITIYWLPKCIFITFLNKYCPSVLTHRSNKEKKIALTFDDVPYGSHEGIVRLLDRFQMKGTFFMISDALRYGDMEHMKYLNVDYMSSHGKQITQTFKDARKSNLAKIVHEGHQIANHGKTNSMHALKTYKSLAQEIETCDKDISDIYNLAGVSPPKTKFYRPGCGLFTSITTRYCRDHNYKLTLGSVYPNDPIFFIPYLNYWYIRWHLESGDVVIFHDRPWTPQMLRYLLPWLEKEGYKCVTLDELFI